MSHALGIALEDACPEDGAQCNGRGCRWCPNADDAEEERTVEMKLIPPERLAEYRAAVAAIDARKGRKGLSGHQSPRAKTTTWLTPPEWIRALGPFDLDPCCPPVMPWPTAALMLTEREDGLAQPWCGSVWLNPPFGQEWPAWVEKLAEHRSGIALIPARTETEAFYRLVWDRADAICFVKGRPHFHREDGTRAPFNSGAPIALIAYGLTEAARLQEAKLGITLWLHPNK